MAMFDTGRPVGIEAAEAAAFVQPIGKDQIREATNTLMKYKAGKANFERRIIENEEWWKLRHWDHIKEQGTTQLKTKSAWLVNVILSKHADAMDAVPEPNCLPRMQDDQPEAQILSKVVPVLLQQNDFEKTWSENWWKKLKAGVAFYGVFWDAGALNGVGDVAVRRIDPLSLFWEPGIVDLQDSRNLFHVVLRDNESLMEEYPQLRGKLGTKPAILNEYIYDDTVNTSDKSPVIDWYYKKQVGGKTVLHYVKYVGDEILVATENEAGPAGGMMAGASERGGGWRTMSAATDARGTMDGDAQLGPVPSGERRDGDAQLGPVPYGGRGTGTSFASPAPEPPPVRGARADVGIGPYEGRGTGGPGVQAPGADSLTERGLYDHGMYPFFADVLFPEEGTPTGYGYIDICKDAQRQIDLMNNAIVANCIAAATPRWLMRQDGGINEDEFADWTKPFVHVNGTMDERYMQQIQVNQLTGNYLTILDQKIAEMKETSGNRDVNNGGAPSGVTAASAIAAMQEQSGKLSRDQIQNSYNCYRQIVLCVIELMRQFYTAPRWFRVLGPEGAEQFVQFSNQGLVVQTMDFDPLLKMPVPHIRKPLFDIEVSAQRQSAYNKMSQNELALQFYQLGMFNPEMADQALAALDMMDFRGREQIRQRVERNGGMMQMIQQLMMLLQQAMGAAGDVGPTGDGRQVSAPTGEGGTGNPSPTGGKPMTATAETGPGGEIRRQNRYVDSAKARAQNATQPR